MSLLEIANSFCPLKDILSSFTSVLKSVRRKIMNDIIVEEATTMSEKDLNYENFILALFCLVYKEDEKKLSIDLSDIPGDCFKRFSLATQTSEDLKRLIIKLEEVT